MPRPTTSVRRSDGSRLAGRLMVAAGRAGDAGAAGVAGTDENGGRDMFCASLSGAGRNGGTPRPLSGGWTGVAGAGRESSSGAVAFKATGVEGSPAGKGAAFVAEIGSSGLRRLNKTLYQTERGASAYHGVHPRNNNLLRIIRIKTTADQCGHAGEAQQSKRRGCAPSPPCR